MFLGNQQKGERNIKKGNKYANTHLSPIVFASQVV